MSSEENMTDSLQNMTLSKEEELKFWTPPDTKETEALASEPDPDDTIKANLLHRIANSDGHFKHQQRGEPDLTFDEKYKIAGEILENKPSTFLTRYGKFMVEDDLQYFQPLQGDYVIDFQLKEIKDNWNSSKSQTKVRNRRYEAMKHLMDEGEYFGDEEMKSRDPLLYEQMLGQYLTEEEVQSQIDKSDLRFSTIILSHMDMVHNNAIYKMQVQAEESQMEEDDEDDELEAEEPEPESSAPSERISEIEKQMLRNEFLKTMQIRFLNGQDMEFDYSKVDNNVEYDPLETRTRDEEERYFDDEDAETVESTHSSLQSQGEMRRASSQDSIQDYDTYDPYTAESQINTGKKTELVDSKEQMNCEFKSQECMNSESHCEEQITAELSQTEEPMTDS